MTAAIANNERMSTLLTGLCAQQRLIRERELIKLKSLMNDRELTAPLLTHILAELTNTQNWEQAAGLIAAASELLPICDQSQIEALYQHALILLDHDESRVRKQAGELMAKALGSLNDQVKTKSAYDHLVGLIKRDLKRDPGADQLPENEKVRQKIIEGQAKRGMTSEQIFHESAGWRHLETSMSALKRLFEVNKESGLLTQSLFDLIDECARHSNRFIRENSFYILSAVMDETLNHHQELIDAFAKLIYKGLSDNWSQVRMASSNSCRSFLFALDEEKRVSFYSLLLPPIALNRYYIAAGVRIHNQETWRLLFPTGGSSYVDASITSFVDFYCAQIIADNHAVREAACACIAELAQKCSPAALEQEWRRMLQALLECFGDDSWPVRDATCIASGAFVRVLPVVTKPMHGQLYAKFMENCTDPIASVRQGGAASLASLISADKEAFLEKTMTLIRQWFDELKEQEAGKGKFGRLETGPGAFGVVRRIGQDEDKMENNTMYSCGSLAPKMKAKPKQSCGGGCSASITFARDSDYWERVDGAIFIISSLVKTFTADKKTLGVIAPLLDELSDTLVRNKQFEEHHVLHETASKQLILIAQGLGKTLFKARLSGVFDIVFCAAKSEVLLTRAAAEECLAALVKFLGEGILRGRVESTHFHELDMLDRALTAPIKVPIHEVTGMKKPEDNYGAFISMTPGQPY